MVNTQRAGSSTPAMGEHRKLANPALPVMACTTKQAKGLKMLEVKKETKRAASIQRMESC